MKILVLEDDPVTHKLLESMLSGWGHQVYAVHTFEQAWEFINAEPQLQLAIIDWMIRDESDDGLELCRQVRASDRPNYLYLIMCSSRNDIVDVEEAMLVGVDDYIYKPLSIQQLQMRLHIAKRQLRARWELRVLNAELDDQVRERTAELVTAQQKAERMADVKSEFLANMSHEIRTPLNGIISLTDLLLDTELKEDQQTDLETIRECSATLKSIIGDVLDFSKIEAGKLPIVPSNFSLRSLIDKTERILVVQASDKEQELVAVVDEKVPDALIGDSVRIQQVLTNLIANAIKFTPDQGGILLHVGASSVTDTSVDIHFVVADSGVGIPPDKQTLIFKAFTQADGSITRKYGGTGLGLTICAKLADLLNGKVWFESKPEVGSAFHFKLSVGLQPVAEKGSSSLSDSTGESGKLGSGIHLLYVDDNAVGRDAIGRSLERYGYQVTKTPGGREALQLLQQKNFTAVITDLQMPEMSGITLTQKIRQSEQDYSSIPILCLTASSNSDDCQSCLDAGMTAFRTKPVDFDELHQLILRETGHLPHEFESAKRVAGEAGKILLAEDDDVNRDSMQRTLHKLGYEVVVAQNGFEALEQLSRGDFSLLLTDLHMPLMNGMELMRRIRSSVREIASIPIVVVTANAAANVRAECLELGMDGFVTKPIDYEELDATIQQAIQHPRNF